MTHVTKARLHIAAATFAFWMLSPLIVVVAGAIYAYCTFTEWCGERMERARYDDDRAGPPWIWLNGKKLVMSIDRLTFEDAVGMSGVPDADVVQYIKTVDGSGTLLAGQAVRILHGSVINVARTVSA